MERYENDYLDDDELRRLHNEGLHTSHPVVDEAELLAAQAAAEAAAAAAQLQPGGAFNNVGQGLVGKNRDTIMQYWQETINLIEHDDHDFKNHQLPLARVKKVMKTDEDVRMISAEAPILFAKGCDIFITELTMRAWIHAEECKRRTLQKSDIAAALTKSDMFDFLIDVVPREEEKPKKAYGSLVRLGTYTAAPVVALHGQGVAAAGAKAEEGGLKDAAGPSVPQQTGLQPQPLHSQLIEQQLLQQQLKRDGQVPQGLDENYPNFQNFNQYGDFSG